MWILLSILLLPIYVAFYYPRWQRRVAINAWYKALNLKTHEANHQKLYKEIDGFSLSRQARSEHDAIEYTYGEIHFSSFIALLSLTKPNANTVFYDLGSGTGKAVLACAMVFNVQKSCGIELFEALNLIATAQQHHLKKLTGYQAQSKALHFINADFLNVDFSDATLIFINATAFFGESWVSVHQALRQLKSGTIIITTSKQLPSEAFIVIKKTRVQMSWGTVDAYIHQRT